MKSEGFYHYEEKRKTVFREGDLCIFQASNTAVNEKSNPPAMLGRIE